MYAPRHTNTHELPLPIMNRLSMTSAAEPLGSSPSLEDIQSFTSNPANDLDGGMTRGMDSGVPAGLDVLASPYAQASVLDNAGPSILDRLTPFMERGNLGGDEELGGVSVAPGKAELNLGSDCIVDGVNTCLPGASGDAVAERIRETCAAAPSIWPGNPSVNCAILPCLPENQKKGLCRNLESATALSIETGDRAMMEAYMYSRRDDIYDQGVELDSVLMTSTGTDTHKSAMANLVDAHMYLPEGSVAAIEPALGVKLETEEEKRATRGAAPQEYADSAFNYATETARGPGEMTLEQLEDFMKDPDGIGLIRGKDVTDSRAGARPQLGEDRVQEGNKPAEQPAAAPEEPAQDSE